MPSPQVLLNDYDGFSSTVFAVFWNKFPLVRGLRIGAIPTHASMRRMLLYHDARFAEDWLFIYYLADVTRRHAANLAVTSTVKNHPDKVKALMRMLEDKQSFIDMCEEAEKAPRGPAWRKLMECVRSLVTIAHSHVPWSDGKRQACYTKYMSTHRAFGPPSFFSSASLVDVTHFLAVLLGHAFTGTDKFPAACPEEFWSALGAATETDRKVPCAMAPGGAFYFNKDALERRAAKNPVATTTVFHWQMSLLRKWLLGLDLDVKRRREVGELRKGAQGVVVCHEQIFEETQRKNLHSHYQVLPPMNHCLCLHLA